MATVSRIQDAGSPFRNAADFGSHFVELFFDALVAAIDVVNAIDEGFALSREAGKDQGGAGAQIRSPLTEMSAPMRASSRAWRNLFSKIVSVMAEDPSACVIRAMYCACISVGKPGYSCVVISEARKASPACTSSTFASEPWPEIEGGFLTRTPTSANLAMTAESWLGSLQLLSVRRPPVIAAATRNVPVSMRSGIGSSAFNTCAHFIE